MALIHILLVDDEPHVVQAIANLLRSQEDISTEIFTAVNVQEALFWLEHSRVDLMITDIEMPGIDGIALVKIVKDRWPSCRTIVLTAHARFDYAYQAIQLGIVAYILKTESDNFILDRIRETLAQQSAEFIQIKEDIMLHGTQENMPSSDCRKSLHRLLTGQRINAVELLSGMGFRTENRCLVLVCIKPHNVTEDALIRLISHFIGPRMNKVEFATVDGCLCCLLEPTSAVGSTDSQITFWLEGMLESIQDTLSIDRICETSIVLCPPVHHVGALQTSFRQAINILAEYHGDNKGVLCTLPQNPGVSLSINNDTIQLIQQYIESHLSENISLQRLSEITCFNASYLSRFFHHKTGQTLNNYIAEVKMDRIRELMKNDEYSLGQIADMSGFESRSYFNRFVRKMCNLTPQQLRDVLSKS